MYPNSVSGYIEQALDVVDSNFHLPVSVTSVIDNGLKHLHALEPYAAKTVVLVPPFLQKTFSGDKFFDGMLLSFPLALIMAIFVPYGKLRHLYSFLCGAFLVQVATGPQWIHGFLTATIVYIMMLILPKDRKMYKYVIPIFLLFHLAMIQLHRTYTNYLGSMAGLVALQMIITQKLYMIAFNLYDGYVLYHDKEDDDSTKEQNNKNVSIATSKCAEFAVKDIPSYVEFMGYAFCFTSVLCGPNFEYSTYCKVCDGTLFYKTDPNTGERTLRGKRLPYNIWPVLKPFLQCFVMVFMMAILQQHYPIKDSIEPRILNLPWLKRFAFLFLAGIGGRLQFYFSWKFAESASNIWYLGFEGFDDNGEPKGWDNTNNVDILKCEVSSRISNATKSWNKTTSNWLKRYVYMRTNGSLLLTYSASAIWHGFYPSYYFLAFTIVLYTVCERLAHQKLMPYLHSLSGEANNNPWVNRAGKIVYWFFFNQMLLYALPVFNLKSMTGVLRLWNSHYFYGHIFAILFLIIVSKLPTVSEAVNKTPSHEDVCGTINNAGVPKTIGTSSKLDADTSNSNNVTNDFDSKAKLE